MAIRAKLVIIFFLIIIAPMFLLWARWQGTALGGIKSVMRQGLGDRAREISDQVTRSLQEHRFRITTLTKQPGLLTYAREAAQSGPPLDEGLKNDLAAFLISHYKEYSALIIIDRKGKPLFKLDPWESNGAPRAVYTDEDFTSEDVVSVPGSFAVPKDQIFVSEVQQDMSGPHVKLIAPLSDVANNVTSALVIKLRAEELLTAAAGPRIPEAPDRFSPAAVILSPGGVVLYATDQAKQGRIYGEAFPDLSDVFTSLIQGQGNSFDRDQWVFSHHLREDTSPKLSILMIGDYSKGARQLEFDSLVLLLLTMLLVIVAMLALYYLISDITDSIRRVTKGAKAIAMGNLTYQIKIKAKDETRVLAEAFNRMADRLREMIRKEGEQKQFESFARLSSVLTHDLKNQILSLSLLVNNMERKFDREGFKEDAMRTLSDSVNNLQNLVAKLSDPRTPTKRFRERSNISLLVDRVVQRTAAQASGKYDVSSELKPDLFALVDGKAVERVIENLVINALEAMPDGGSLRVATWQDNGTAFVAVADTGKGMTEEFMRERLFHPFATTKKKGIGLGLYSCRDIIEQHGGRIDVASRVNVGTEFKLILPMKAEDLSTGDLKTAAVGSAPI
ncbi:MAG TPA: HAMP domain-containing sensor histidine kinase [Blastocatellia bacterium]|nr:HAMP domain-containing sensor histidine kinase [Blastocatellia bacterium]